MGAREEWPRKNFVLLLGGKRRGSELTISAVRARKEPEEKNLARCLMAGGQVFGGGIALYPFQEGKLQGQKK